MTDRRGTAPWPPKGWTEENVRNLELARRCFYDGALYLLDADIDGVSDEVPGFRELVDLAFPGLRGRRGDQELVDAIDALLYAKGDPARLEEWERMSRGEQIRILCGTDPERIAEIRLASRAEFN